MLMTENQKIGFDDSKSFIKETVPLACGSKVYCMNGLTRNNYPSEFEVRDRDEFLNSKFGDDFSMDTENESRDSLQKENQNELLYHQSRSLRESADRSSSDSTAKDSNLEHECLKTVEELKYGSGGEYRDSRLPYIAASDLLEKGTSLCTEKDVMECELPELEICYKQTNNQIVKDICIDEGIPIEKSLFLNESIKDDRLGHSFPLTLKCNGHHEATEGDSDVKLIQSNGLSASSFNSTKGIRANEHTTKEESDYKLVAQEKQNLLSRKSFSEDTAKHIAFNFSSSPPVAATVTDGRAENINEPPVESVDVLDRKDTDDEQAHCLNNEASSVEEVHEPFLNIKDGFSNGLSATVDAYSDSRKDMIDTNVHNQSHEDKNENSDHLSSHDHLQFASDISSINSDGQASELYLPKFEHGDSGNDSAVRQEKYDAGESSSSSFRLVTYSGAIAISGSLSLRSDSSAATSGRSFSFPILQPEWNSSPVRMTKADNSHFRKHRGWRSGLLCCRF